MNAKLSCNGYWIEDCGAEVLVGADGSEAALLRLRGDSAKRAYELVRRSVAGEVPRNCNCHAAADFILDGRNADTLRWNPGSDVGAVRMSVRQAVETLELPCGYQLHAMDTSCDGDGATYLAHSGVLLGMAGEVPLALEKDGTRGDVRICPLDTVRADHKRLSLDAFLFYGTPAEAGVDFLTEEEGGVKSATCSRPPA